MSDQEGEGQDQQERVRDRDDEPQVPPTKQENAAGDVDGPQEEHVNLKVIGTVCIVCVVRQACYLCCLS